MKTPTQYQSIKLGNIIKLEYGKSLLESKRNPCGKYPVYGANGEKDRTDEYYYNKRSIIVGRKGSAGEITLTEEKFWPLDVTYFVTFDYNKYDLNFIYYLLSFLELPKLARGVKPGINRNEVYSLQARIPPLSEQQRIAIILDKAFAMIDKTKDNAEKNLQNTRHIFESQLQGIFQNTDNQWKEKTLKQITSTFGRGKSKHRPRNDKNYTEEITHLFKLAILETPIITLLNILRRITKWGLLKVNYGQKVQSV